MNTTPYDGKINIGDEVLVRAVVIPFENFTEDPNLVCLRANFPNHIGSEFYSVRALIVDRQERSLMVGDPVEVPISVGEFINGHILAISNDFAWVEREDGVLCTSRLVSLMRIT